MLKAFKMANCGYQWKKSMYITTFLWIYVYHWIIKLKKQILQIYKRAKPMLVKITKKGNLEEEYTLRQDGIGFFLFLSLQKRDANYKEYSLI